MRNPVGHTPWGGFTINMFCPFKNLAQLIGNPRNCMDGGIFASKSILRYSECIVGSDGTSQNVLNIYLKKLIGYMAIVVHKTFGHLFCIQV